MFQYTMSLYRVVSGEMGCEVTFWLPDNYDYGI